MLAENPILKAEKPLSFNQGEGKYRIAWEGMRPSSSVAIVHTLDERMHPLQPQPHHQTLPIITDTGPHTTFSQSNALDTPC